MLKYHEAQKEQEFLKCLTVSLEEQHLEEQDCGETPDERKI